jgi:hypothetical protein
MPYRRFRKTLFRKKRGKWTKKKTYPSAKAASTAMKRLREKETAKSK